MQDELEEMFEKADELLLGGKKGGARDRQKVAEAVSKERILLK